ncbi:MAG: PQQ-dependent sugar dehydrogenase [Planctomycetaceae bacterium]
MKTFVSKLWSIVFGCLICVVASAAHGEDVRSEFECRFAGEAPTIDGVADDAAWQRADVIDHFYLPWLQQDSRPARAATKARLLWDRQYLYFFAEMDDDDLDAGDDGPFMSWRGDVFELFFKPAEDKPGYYNFQLWAGGTVKDEFLPKRFDGGFKKSVDDGTFHIDAKVVTRGTLNVRTDTDEGWTVEGRIPWSDLNRTGGRPVVDEQWRFALCRYDRSSRRDSPELSTCAPLASQEKPNFHHYEEFALLKFIGPQRRDIADVDGDATSDRLTLLKQNWNRVPSKVAGSPEPPLPFVATRTMPKLSLTFPVVAVNEPGSRRLYLLDQKWSSGPTRLIRTTDNPVSGEVETLYDFPHDGLAYSICFHPQYSDNGYVYLGWNAAKEAGGEKYCMITRLTVDRDSDTVDPESAVEIISWLSDGHNGVAMAFGLDGMMYVTSGDGTSDSDTNLTGQGLDHLLAKVLRIDVEHPDDGRMYSVPSDNPFVGQDGVRPETWAYGLRNPWRMTVDPKTGDLWVGNNGQDLYEQAYLVQRGDNYGWSVYEGSHVFYANRELGPTPHVKPTLEHPHSESRSLTGGVVYYGERFPELAGAYIYGDYSTGKIWGAKVSGGSVMWHKELADTTLQIAAFAIDSDGELLIVDHKASDGGLYTFERNPAPAGAAENFPKKLSDSGLFASVAGHEVHPGVIPYSVNSPLWSDGSIKSRYVYLPPTMTVDGDERPTQIDFQTGSSWDFPDGTVTVKSFALEQREGDPASRRWVETRFLVRQQGEWFGYSYAWNDEQTDAFLVDKEGRDAVFQVSDAGGTATEQPWRFPSRTECMVCHSRAAKFVLGLSSLQLNRVHDYDGVAANQLEVFEWLGVLKLNGAAGDAAEGQRTAPAASSLLAESADKLDRLPDPYDETADLTSRVRSYLHSNCAQCHVEAGGGNAQMKLDFASSLERANIIDVVPLHDKFGIADAKLVAPGSPEQSVLLHRMTIRGRGQMPQLATAKVDQRAVALLARWITELPPSTSSASDN